MVPVASVRVPRAPTYSGSRLDHFRFCLQGLHLLRLSFQSHSAIFFIFPCRGPTTPAQVLVWAAPISLATTLGITFVFFSFGYLDVSVPRVPLTTLSIHVVIPDISIRCVPAFGYLRINAHLQLPAAFRSLSRPSSAPCT